MPSLEILVKKGRVLGHTVYRGEINASEIYDALWVDIYHPEDNPDGYQRPHNEVWSGRAANYAEDGNAFWPEVILNLRAEIRDGRHVPMVRWLFIPDKQRPEMGTLRVEYNNSVKEIGGQEKPWMRAFSLVDGQHRILGLAKSDKSISICILENLTAYEEALLFRIINTNQHRMDTSLVDTNIYNLAKKDGKEYLEQPWITLARKLWEDASSPFYKLVDTGGPRRKDEIYIVRQRTLVKCMQDSIPKYIIENKIRDLNLPESERMRNFDLLYNFIRSFWCTAKQLWGDAWELTDKKFKRYKLLTTPGLRGLSFVCYKILDTAIIQNDYTPRFIESALSPAKYAVEWTKTGPFKNATGNAGANLVRDFINTYVLPDIPPPWKR